MLAYCTIMYLYKVPESHSSLFLVLFDFVTYAKASYQYYQILFPCFFLYFYKTKTLQLATVCI